MREEHESTTSIERRRAYALRQSPPLGTGGVGTAFGILSITAVLSVIVAGWSLVTLFTALGIGIVAILVTNLSRYWWAYYALAPLHELKAYNVSIVTQLIEAREESRKAQEVGAVRIQELESKLEALTVSTIHIESVYTYELPTAEECPEMRFVDLYWRDEPIGSLPPGPQAAFGSNFTEPGTRHQVAARTGDTFVLVRAINDGDVVLVDVEVDVEYEFFDPVKGRVEPVPKAGCTAKLGRIAPRGQGYGFFYVVNRSEKNLFPVPITQARAKRNGASVPVSVFYSDDFRKAPSRAVPPK